MQDTSIDNMSVSEKKWPKPNVQMERLSKRMSQYLRHGAGKNGTEPLDDAGWAPVSRICRMFGVGEREVLAVCAPGPHNLKNRFETVTATGGTLIRARQGHSLKDAQGLALIKSEAILTPLGLEDLQEYGTGELEKGKKALATRRDDKWWVIHGTSFGRIKRLENLGFARDGARISSDPRIGLNRMGRTHIHMSPSATVERWHSWYNLEVWVDIAAAMAAGIKFWISGNDVILSEGNEHGVIPSEFLHPVARS
jgi:2'-phosphotransferase